ncbi:MFS transporter [Marinimicrobium alkaliphilum]|uniref:MFS transporter n=1 Tax=Marinimicrobium alkaliphilum TaxID=2202654 RepID=UPI0018E0B4AE|nr:MFS transporter [Marinimicrobium alkaliphilum]
MPTSETIINIDTAEQLVRRLCQHWSHKFDVEQGEQSTLIRLPAGECELFPEADRLRVRVTALDDKLGDLKDVVAEHLKRMEKSGLLAVKWKDDKSSKAKTRHGIILLIASVMPTMAIISLVPVLPLLLREFASVPGSSFLVPVALTIPALCVALFSPLAGWLSDRTGRKKLLVTALVLYALVGLVPLMLTGLYSLIVARVALGVTEAAIMTVATTMIGDYFQGRQRERWVAAQVAVVALSAIVLIAVGGMLGEAFGARGPFVLYALALPIAVAAGFILFEPHVTAEPSSNQTVRLPYRSVMPIVAITFGAGLLFYTMIVNLGPILGLTGVISPAKIGAVGAVANVGVALGTQIFRKFDAFSAQALLAGGLSLCAIGFVGTGLATSFPVAAVFAVVACVGGGMLLPNLLTWTLRVLPAEVRGRGTGLWTGTFFLAQFAAPLIATALMYGVGGLGSVLVLYAGLAAIGALAAVVSARIVATRA